MLKKLNTACLLTFIVSVIHAHRSVLDPRHAHFTPETRIIGGLPVKPHSAPYIVALTMLNPVTGETTGCAGSLISDRHVLTAAHCVHWKHVITMQFGAHRRSYIEPEQTVVRSGWPVIHPNYDPESSNYDLAIIRLPTPLDLRTTPYVTTIKLPSQDNLHQTYVSEEVQSYGWGVTDDKTKKVPSALMGVNLTVIDTTTCFQQMQSTNYPRISFLYPHDICTNGQGPQGTVGHCSGDSGGPLVHNGTLIGVITRGIDEFCSNNKPSIYISVAKTLGWIKEQMANF